MPADINTMIAEARKRHAAAAQAFTPVPDDSIEDEDARAAAHAVHMRRRAASIAAAQNENLAHLAAQLVVELMPADIENPGEASEPIAAAVNALAATVLAAVKE